MRGGSYSGGGKTSVKLLRTAIPVVCVCLLLFFWGLGAVPFYTRGEPREAVVVWEICSTGEWILPLRNGTEIPSKPPLFHWLGALLAKALGRKDRPYLGRAHAIENCSKRRGGVGMSLGA